MTDTAIMQRMRDAKKAAIQKYRDIGYKIYESDNQIFCFIANSPSGPIACHQCMVRVVAGKATDKDIKIIKEQRILPGQTKAITWRESRGRRWFRIEFDHLNNIVNSVFPPD